jgi:hypothetical protein
MHDAAGTGPEPSSSLATMSKQRNKTELGVREPFDEMRSWALIGGVFLATGLGVWLPLVLAWH